MGFNTGNIFLTENKTNLIRIKTFKAIDKKNKCCRRPIIFLSVYIQKNKSFSKKFLKRIIN